MPQWVENNKGMNYKADECFCYELYKTNKLKANMIAKASQTHNLDIESQDALAFAYQVRTTFAAYFYC